MFQQLQKHQHLMLSIVLQLDKLSTCWHEPIIVAISCLFLCVAMNIGTSWARKTIQGGLHLFWAMAHYIEQPAPWDPNDLVYYVEIRPWPNSETFYYAIVLHYDSGWQTWIGQFPSIGRHSTHWEHFQKPDYLCQTGPHLAWLLHQGFHHFKRFQQKKNPMSWNYHRLLCFTPKPKDTSQHWLPEKIRSKCIRVQVCQ